MRSINTLKPIFKEFLNHKPLFFSYLSVIFLFQLTLIVPDLLLAKLIDSFTEYNLSKLDYTQFIDILLVIFTLFLLANILQRIVMIAEPIIRANLKNLLKIIFLSKIFNNLTKLDFEYLSKNNTGKQVSRIIRGGNSFLPLIDMLTWNIAPFFIQLPIIFAILFSIHFNIAIILILSALIYIPIGIYFSDKAAIEYKSNYKKIDVATGKLTDYVSNLFIIKIMNKELFVSKKFEKSIQFFRNFGERIGKLYAKWNTAQRITALIGQTLAMVLAVKLAINGEITVGSLALIFIFSNKIFMLADWIVYSLDTIFRSASEFNAASKILNEKSKIKDDKDAKNLKITEGKITFNNVSFNYKNNKVFSKFNLEIKSGETVGIVGKSGSGKTTLIKLLYRMYDLANGYISIDKQNIRHVKKNSIRNSMSLVPQETLLFDDTIYNNVKFANVYSNYQDVINALKKAELWEFIKKLPDKEKTIVGERGIKLSGGEKQRIAIARSILANKKIIILDEATSSLDSETESKIRDTLDKLTKGKTTIIIAHRLSTVMNADKIVVFSEGEIVEVGTHKQLLKKKGKYSELWRYQSQGFI